MFKFWEHKKKKEPQPTNWAALLEQVNSEGVAISEPVTLAKMRLEGGAQDIGAHKAIKAYNQHKVRLQNQWINPLTSVNTGFSNANYSFFYYQPVNYYECYALAQDPMFAKIFNILSETPFGKGGNIVTDDGLEVDKDKLEIEANKYKIWDALKQAVRSEYVCGGCLLFMDFGQTPEELTSPLDLKKMNMKRFKGFRHIDPINVVATDVNTVNPSVGDYMRPKTWYVVGLGQADASHFLKFDANLPELPMRPLTLYFGMPLTQLIKQDVANSNLASQGLANLLGRFRYNFIKTEDTNFVTSAIAQFKAKLQYMSVCQDNYGFTPLKSTEDVIQLTTSLSGMAEDVETFYLLIAAKTDIPYTELMGKGAQGMDATGEGDRRKWYDKCRSIQQSVKLQLLKMYGIVAGRESGKFVEFTDYSFNPLEESTDKERAENLQSYATVAGQLIELGAKQEQVFDWLKTFKDLHLDNLEFDADTEGLEGYDDVTGDLKVEFAKPEEKPAKADNDGETDND